MRAAKVHRSNHYDNRTRARCLHPRDSGRVAGDAVAVTDRETTGVDREVGFCKPPVHTQFQPGNPGRPKGSKNKLCEDFLGDMQEAWKEHGKDAIKEMATKEPGRFVATVASLVPKDMNVNINPMADLTDDELAERIRTLAAQLGPFLAHGIGDVEAGDGCKGGKALPSPLH